MKISWFSILDSQETVSCSWHVILLTEIKTFKLKHVRCLDAQFACNPCIILPILHMYPSSQRRHFSVLCFHIVFIRAKLANLWGLNCVAWFFLVKTVTWPVECNFFGLQHSDAVNLTEIGRMVSALIFRADFNSEGFDCRKSLSNSPPCFTYWNSCFTNRWRERSSAQAPAQKDFGLYNNLRTFQERPVLSSTQWFGWINCLI